jgi:hypothetical protein
MIFFINLVFGWTVLGWIAALIWAIVESPKVKIKTPIEQHWEDARTAAREISESGRLVLTEEEKKRWSEPFYK